VSKLAAQAASAVPETGSTITPVRESDNGANSRGAFQTWTGKAIGEQIHAKHLAEAHRLWLHHNATRKPQLRDMYSKSLNMHCDTMLVLKLGNDYICVAQSDSYIRTLGQDLRGFRLSQLKIATINSFREVYDDCLAANRPAYARYISSLSDQNVYWEALVLPLSADESGEPVFNMIYCSLLSEKIDVLQILYDRSPVGIIAAVPIKNGQNKTDDARILTMNAKAREFLKQDPSRNLMHTVGELIRYLSERLGWTGISSSLEGQATRIDYRDPDGQQFAMTIELVNQLILISLAKRGAPDPKSASLLTRLLGLG
jgi:PAS domain-containing protein